MILSVIGRVTSPQQEKKDRWRKFLRAVFAVIEYEGGQKRRKARF
jgi:hypothetical protein